MTGDPSGLSDPDVIASWLRNGRHTLDLLKEIVPHIPRPWKTRGANGNSGEAANDASSAPPVSNALYGFTGDIPALNARINDILFSNSRPFVLRFGTRISMPGDNDRIETSIREKAIFDWTYVLRFDNITSDKRKKDRRHIARAYFSKDGRPRNDVSTSVLRTSQVEPPDDFHLGLIIFGVDISGNNFTDIIHVDKSTLHPAAVVFCLEQEDGRYSAVTDPIAMRYWLDRTIETIFEFDDDGAFSGGLLFPGEPDAPPVESGATRLWESLHE